MEDGDEKFEEIMDNIRCSTFHMSDAEARPIIDGYLERHPELLTVHEREWYHKYC
jgi:hypothetical protein